MYQHWSFMTDQQQYLLECGAKQARSYFVMKRALDIAVSMTGLITLAPLFIVVAIAIYLDSGGPVIFAQTRVGQKGHKFKMLKFRSMITGAESLLSELMDQNEADGPVFKIRDDPRLTRVGKLIRKTSIDELPQLINVLRGDMSLVGPRPPLPAEVEQYTPYQKQRIMVIPGITCFWQISGRSHVSFEDWVEMDLKYIRERNLWLDISIVLLTLPVVLKGKGAY